MQEIKNSGQTLSDKPWAKLVDESHCRKNIWTPLCFFIKCYQWDFTKNEAARKNRWKTVWNYFYCVADSFM